MDFITESAGTGNELAMLFTTEESPAGDYCGDGNWPLEDIANQYEYKPPTEKHNQFLCVGL